FGGGAAWSTGEVHEGIGFALVGCGGKENDLQRDFAAVLLRAVFEDFVGPALRFELRAGKLAVAQDQFWFGLSDGARGLQRKDQRKGDEEECFSHWNIFG